MAGAVFGEVELSLFVAGAVFGEIWNDSRSAKCCIFQYKMPVVGVKSNLGCEAGCGVTVSFSDHGRIQLGSSSDPARIGPALEMTFQLFSRNFSEILENHFAWQAQYLVMLEDATCCSGLHVNVKKIKQKYLNHNLVLRIWNFSVYVAKHSCNDLDYGRPPVYRHNLGQSSL